MAQICCHPYSKALLDAVFDTKMDFSKKIEPIKGEPPSPLDVPTGCPFQDRCDKCMEICRKKKPKDRLKRVSRKVELFSKAFP